MHLHGLWHWNYLCCSRSETTSEEKWLRDFGLGSSSTHRSDRCLHSCSADIGNEWWAGDASFQLGLWPTRRCCLSWWQKHSRSCRRPSRGCGRRTVLKWSLAFLGRQFSDLGWTLLANWWGCSSARNVDRLSLNTIRCHTQQRRNFLT